MDALLEYLLEGLVKETWTRAYEILLEELGREPTKEEIQSKIKDLYSERSSEA